MPRDLPIGNGSLLINFDHNYYVRDIYYPNVGGIEHTLGHLSRLGIWTEEHFSWVHSHEWERSLRYSDEHGRFVRTVYPESGGYKIDPIPDSSLYAIFAFDIYDAQDPRVKRTMDAIRNNLTVKTPVGGFARYKNDYLHRVSDDFANVPGDPWFICTLWMAQYLIAKSMTITELNEALPLLEWVAKHALESGVLPEQLHPNTGNPLSISPLSWSHGEFILTVHKFLEKLKSINN